MKIKGPYPKAFILLVSLMVSLVIILVVGIALENKIQIYGFLSRFKSEPVKNDQPVSKTAPTTTLTIVPTPDVNTSTSAIKECLILSEGSWDDPLPDAVRLRKPLEWNTDGLSLTYETEQGTLQRVNIVQAENKVDFQMTDDKTPATLCADGKFELGCLPVHFLGEKAESSSIVVKDGPLSLWRIRKDYYAAVARNQDGTLRFAAPMGYCGESLNESSVYQVSARGAEPFFLAVKNDVLNFFAVRSMTYGSLKSPPRPADSMYAWEGSRWVRSNCSELAFNQPIHSVRTVGQYIIALVEVGELEFDVVVSKFENNRLQQPIWRFSELGLRSQPYRIDALGEAAFSVANVSAQQAQDSLQRFEIVANKVQAKRILNGIEVGRVVEPKYSAYKDDAALLVLEKRQRFNLLHHSPGWISFPGLKDPILIPGQFGSLFKREPDRLYWTQVGGSRHLILWQLEDFAPLRYRLLGCQ